MPDIFYDLRRQETRLKSCPCEDPVPHYQSHGHFSREFSKLCHTNYMLITWGTLGYFCVVLVVRNCCVSCRLSDYTNIFSFWVIPHHMITQSFCPLTCSHLCNSEFHHYNFYLCNFLSPFLCVIFYHLSIKSFPC